MESSSTPPDLPSRPVPPADPSGAPVPVSGSYQRPADYYETPPGAPEGKKGFPRWILYGCGGLGCLGLLVIFGLGAWMMKGGGTKLSGFVVSQLEKDADELFAADVTPEERAAFRQELARLRERIDDGRIDMMALQPVLTEIQGSVGDQSLSAEEVRTLTETVRELNDRTPDAPLSVRANPSASGLRAL